MFAVGFVVDFLLIYFIQEKVCDHGGLAASISFFTKLNSVSTKNIKFYQMRIFFDLVPTHTNAFGVHLSALLSDMRNLALALVI